MKTQTITPDPDSNLKIICMDKTTELAKGIMRMAISGELSQNQITFLIRRHWEEATALVKNINDTSIGLADRMDRMIEFEKSFGLSKTHLL